MSNHLIYLSLGSNLGRRRKFLEDAISLLKESGQFRIKAVSPVYETEPVGYTEQSRFLNLALSGESDLEPDELLEVLIEVESSVGRKAEFKNGPREIDIDMLLYDDMIVESDKLRIPHPRLRNREFALRPLLNLNQDLSDPKTNIPYAEYLAEVRGSAGVSIRDDIDFKYLISK